MKPLHVYRAVFPNGSSRETDPTWKDNYTHAWRVAWTDDAGKAEEGIGFAGSREKAEEKARVHAYWAGADSAWDAAERRVVRRGPNYATSIEIVRATKLY